MLESWISAVTSRSPLRALLMTGLSAGALWPMLAIILSADRGLDLTDEGLYLLEADPPSSTAAWNYPFGWHTGPMFRAVGFDVAAFRTLGAVLLVLASAWLGIQSWRLGVQLGARPARIDESTRRSGLLEDAAAAAAGGVGGLVYYAGFLRTPSYNWLVAFGLCFAVVGFLRLLVDSLNNSVRTWSSITITALGLFLTVPAKPTTPILFALLAFPVLARISGARTALRHLVAVAGTASAALALAVLLGIWPTRFFDVFLRATRLPFGSEHTVAGAISAILELPVTVLASSPALALLVLVALIKLSRPMISGRSTRVLLRILVGGAVLASMVVPLLVRSAYEERAGVLNLLIRGQDVLPVSYYLQRASALVLAFFFIAASCLIIAAPSVTPSRRRWVLAALCVLVPTSLLRLQQSSLFTDNAPTRLLDPRLAASMLSLVLLAQILRAVEPKEERVEPGRPRLHRVSAAGLVASFVATMPIVAAFGTANSLHGQLQLFVLFFVAAALVLGAASSTTVERTPALVAIVTTVALAGGVAMLDSYQRPYWYPSEPITAQSVPTLVGQHGATLRLDPLRSAFFDDLRVSAEAAGWVPGTRLYGVTVSWGASTVPWHLGAEVPDSIMPTLQREDRLLFNLANDDLRGWRDAWVLVEIAAPTAFEGAPEASRRFANIFATEVGRRFPDDYEVVWTAPFESGWFANVELWKPVDAAIVRD